MLKWAMRIVAVGGALLAMAVGTAAWMHLTQEQEWSLATPVICSSLIVSPRYVYFVGWRRSEMDPLPALGWDVGPYGVRSIEYADKLDGHLSSTGSKFSAKWHGFIVVRGYDSTPSMTKLLAPTWFLIAALLLPMGLWAGIGWRQRRRVRAGHCANCGYDLCATPDKCPECGRAVGISAE